MTGRVVTFYSYKGGVGRSFALANVGVVLAQWGYRVLAVDWDIEAPGLNHYFSERTDPLSPGVIEFLDHCRTGKSLRWDRYATAVDLDDAKGDLKLMAAHAEGSRDYAAMVQDLDWDELYREHDLGGRLEELRAQWVEHLDFVLVDSRTGVTDFSGLTTVQLPDVLAFMFTANDQSLAGCARVARRAMEARRAMPVDRPAILPLPIPARFEQREEYDRAQQWRLRFREELKPFFDTWAPPHTDLTKLIDLLTIPYVPRWTFGEELAVLLEPVGSAGVRSPSHAASYACETIAALLVQRFEDVGLLTSSRDEFVHGARSRAASTSPRVLTWVILADQESEQTAWEIQFTLHEVFSRARVAAQIIVEDGSDLTGALSDADAYLIVIDRVTPKNWVRARMSMVLRYSARSKVPKPIVPVVMEGAEDTFRGTFAANFIAIFVSSKRSLEDQLIPVIGRLGFAA